MTAGSVAVVIVNYRTPALALESLAAVAAERTSLPGLRAVVVDGGSEDASAETLAEGLCDPRFSGWAELLALPINGGFGWANNQAMLRLIQSSDPPDYIHLLNPDAIVEPGAIAALAEVLDRHPRCAAVGSLLLDPDGTPSGSAFRFMSAGRELVRGSRTDALGRLLGIRPVLVADAPDGEVDWATGASLLLRRAALAEVGLFDTGFFLYFEEVELMWRLRRAGWSVRHAPASRVRHIGGVATGMTYNDRTLRLAPPLPAYWFASRRRLLALTRGRGGTAAAGLGWLAGNTLFLLRRAAGLAGGRVVTRREARDLVCHGLWPSAFDLAPAVTRADDPPGTPPAWMRTGTSTGSD